MDNSRELVTPMPFRGSCISALFFAMVAGCAQPQALPSSKNVPSSSPPFPRAEVLEATSVQDSEAAEALGDCSPDSDLDAQESDVPLDSGERCKEREQTLLPTLGRAELTACTSDRDCQIACGAQLFNGCCPRGGTSRKFYAINGKLYWKVCGPAIVCPAIVEPCHPPATLLVPVCRDKICRVIDLNIPVDCPIPRRYKGLRDGGGVWK